MEDQCFHELKDLKLKRDGREKHKETQKRDTNESRPDLDSTALTILFNRPFPAGDERKDPRGKERGIPVRFRCRPGLTQAGGWMVQRSEAKKSHNLELLPFIHDHQEEESWTNEC